jgi:hypothetical protein
MKSTPVLYSPAMVLAHLRSHNPKTQTRRLFSDRALSTMKLAIRAGEITDFLSTGILHEFDAPYIRQYCPYGGPGDQIWAKETFRCDLHSDFDIHDKDRIHARGHYTADNTPFEILLTEAESAKFHQWRDQSGTHPSIFMFRSLSRIQRTITAVRAQRLQDITAEDAMAEGLSTITKDDGQTWKWGIPDKDGLPGTDNHGWNWCDWNVDPRQAYRRLWNSLNGTPQPVFKKDASGKAILSHYVCHPWALEDLHSYRGGSLLRQIQEAPSFGYEVTEDNGTYILTRPGSTTTPVHIHTNPWVWALTYA